MQLPVIRGVIDRRILVNYRIDPSVLASILPAPFSPKLIHGVGMVGVCLIRLKSVRPHFLPSWVGFSSENAAHRMAVEWEDDGAVREGVYVRRRDTNLWLNTLAGGRIFPGVHHHAKFVVAETTDHFNVAVRSDDRQIDISVQARRSDELPSSSIFQSAAEASAFFESGRLGYSDASTPSRYQGLELRCLNWSAEPLDVEAMHSNVFEDESLFPKGSIEFDCALLMRGIEHEWHGRSDLCCDQSATDRGLLWTAGSGGRQGLAELHL
ncbi:MAG: DUF2071 domain-containing protein [Pirellulales bacterium]|nr:DUF2071 domain-containing protein [Pirellulales bacterium]